MNNYDNTNSQNLGDIPMIEEQAIQRKTIIDENGKTYEEEQIVKIPKFPNSEEIQKEKQEEKLFHERREQSMINDVFENRFIKDFYFLNAEKVNSQKNINLYIDNKNLKFNNVDEKLISINLYPDYREKDAIFLKKVKNLIINNVTNKEIENKKSIESLKESIENSLASLKESKECDRKYIECEMKQENIHFSESIKSTWTDKLLQELEKVVNDYLEQDDSEETKKQRDEIIKNIFNIE